jgi:hypothetical protein
MAFAGLSLGHVAGVSKKFQGITDQYKVGLNKQGIKNHLRIDDFYQHLFVAAKRIRRLKRMSNPL